MISRRQQDLVFKTIDEVSRQTLLPQVSAKLVQALAALGFVAVGINGLPPAGEDADPHILTESTPEGFRDLYVHERFYLVDHICAHARVAYEPFRYSEAPYDVRESRSHRRFMQALDTFEMGKGLIVPIGRPSNMPACVWLAGENPELDDEAVRATQLVVLFAASKARALSSRPHLEAEIRALTAREREALQWIASGKTSWEVSMISKVSERAVNKVIADAMAKLGAVTRTQAVVTAIRRAEIDL